MKIIKLSCILTLFLSLGVWADTPHEQAREFLNEARETGSHLAFRQAELLNHRHSLKMDLGKPRLSRYSLASDIFGGFALFEGTYRGSLDLFTGQRAVDESLQLETIESRDTSAEERDRVLEDVTPLAIESHPWSEMLQELPEKPEPSPILQLVPHDHFMLHFNRGATVGELESSLQSLSASLNHLFDLETSLQVRRMVAERLELGDYLKHEAKLGEMVFVSEDLDFYPSTHYAVIISLDSWARLPGFALLRTAKRGRVGKYFVVASSSALFQRIRAVHQNRLPSMGDSLDYQYAHAVIDRPRDGLVYLSEAFILRLVSPKYRINSSRRLAALDQVVKAQYQVWASRCLTGVWPKSLTQMAQDGYLSATDVHPQLKISPQGLVVHSVWGDLRDIKALSDVPIPKVSQSEISSYDQFRERYQQYWTKYFDPIGVGFKVAEDLSFHTIILPLIDNSDYRRLAQFAGGPSRDFDGLARAEEMAGISLHSRFDLERLVRALDGDEGEAEPDAWRAKVNAELNRELGLSPQVDVFSVFGDEVTGFIIPEVVERGTGFEEFGAIALELRDKKEFRRMGDSLLKGSGRQAQEHAGLEYFETPFFGSSNLYAIYHEDFVYLSLSRTVTHQMCQSLSQPAPAVASKEHNLYWRADFHRGDLLLKAYRELTAVSGLRYQVRDALGYLADQRRLSEKGVDTLGLLASAPERLYGVPLQFTSEGGRVGGLSPREVQLGLPGTTENAISLAQLIESFESEQTKLSLQQLQWLNIGLDFTPEGLSTRVRVNRPRSDKTWF